MKRIFLASVLMVIFSIVALGTDLVFADSYDVTANYGKRVTEQGACEEVGAVTITPEVGGDTFYADQVITMQLLGGLEVCNAFYAVYDMVAGSDTHNAAASAASAAPGANQFAVQGNFMADYVTITFGTSLTPALALEPIIYGHDNYSQLCVDLSGTLYTASDPLYQTLKATYSSSPGNHTFSGDLEIATVEDSAVEVDVCGTIETVSLETVSVPCGRGFWGPYCIFEITDTAIGAFVSGETYQFTIGKTIGAKAGIGFGSISIYYDGYMYVPITRVTRFNTMGMIIDGTEPIYQPPPSDQPYQLYVDTAQIVVEFEALGPGTYEVYAIGYFNTCEVTTGPWVVDISNQKIPCGGSFGEQDFTILQVEERCIFSISPEDRTVPSGGGSYQINVSALSGCSWTVSENVDWITIISGSSGSGDGTVSYSVEPNIDISTRIGSINVAGINHIVTQSGVLCNYSISPMSRIIPSDGGSYIVSVSTTSACSWTASEDVSWITITSGSDGTGEGSVAYSVEPNDDTSSRSAIMTIAGESHIVSQKKGSSSTLVSVTAIDSLSSEPGTDIGVYRIQRTGDTSSNLSVFFTMSGSATNGMDYIIPPSPIFMPADLLYLNVIFEPIDDADCEGDEIALMTLSPSEEYELGLSEAEITIYDDEPPPTAYYQDADGDEYGDPNKYVLACSQPEGYVLDSTDNCPLTYNPEQEDSDEDGCGDACDGRPDNPRWVTIKGTITYDGIPLCAMVLANGQYMFTCDPDEKGVYDLDVPLNPAGEITLLGFCSGLLPFKITLLPETALAYDIHMAACICP